MEKQKIKWTMQVLTATNKIAFEKQVDVSRRPFCIMASANHGMQDFDHDVKEGEVRLAGEDDLDIWFKEPLKEEERAILSSQMFTAKLNNTFGESWLLSDAIVNFKPDAENDEATIEYSTAVWTPNKKAQEHIATFKEFQKKFQEHRAKIKLAPQEQTEYLNWLIDDILSAIAEVTDSPSMKDALVTDESSIWDFFPFEEKPEEIEARLKEILGVEVHMKDYLITIAKRMSGNG